MVNIRLATVKRKSIRANTKSMWVLFTMLLPGLLFLIINNYIPMLGVIIAFKDFKSDGHGFISSLLSSRWVGFDNFKFFIQTPYAFQITKNTILYNLLFIALTLVTAVPAALALNEIKNKFAARVYQSVMFLPFILSWVVVSYLVYSFLSVDMGLVNRGILEPLGLQRVQWYGEAKYWPFILPIAQVWKYLGYNSVIYLAGITTIDSEYYEAARIDGASKLQQMLWITLPQLVPLMITLTLLQLGRMFFADFGLFFQVTKNAGALYSSTLVIDTYVYNSLINNGDIGMSSAAGLYQAAVGFVLVFLSNLVVRRINSERALF